MSYQVPYHRDTFRPLNDAVPGNETNQAPVEFDLAPGDMADLARLKSIVLAAAGLTEATAWSPDVQQAVTAAAVHGAPGFTNTVEAIRNFTVPAILAKRVGLLAELPQSVKPGDGGATPDPNAPVPITNGRAFALVCGFVPVMALHVASQIVQLSAKADVDPRFFALPSGSGTDGTPQPTITTAGSARPTSRRRGTAGSR